MVPVDCTLESNQGPQTLLPWTIIIQRAADDEVVCSQSVKQPYLIFGRSADCDLMLDHPSVSEKQLYLQLLPDRVVCVDLADRSVAVDSTRISLGEFHLSCSGDTPLIAIDQSPRTAFEEPIAVWELANARGNLQAITERRVRHSVTLIGRGPACRFRVDHDSMSSIHASIVAIGGQLHVVDLCSRTGISVNGERVKFSPLKDGDELTIGACRGRIRLLSPSDAPAEEHSIPVGPVALPGESQELVLDLLHQFLAMHQTVLEQTQRLMTVAAQKLDSGPEFVGEVQPQRLPPKLDSAEVSPAATPPRSSQGELHAWLNGQLANLSPDDEGGLARLWKRLSGA